MTAQFIEIDGKKMAVLAIADYEALLEAAEEREDCQLAAEADRRRAAGEEYVPSSLVDRLIDGENALRVWREYRGLSLNRLAEVSGVNKAMVSQLENDKAHGKPATWRALADALKVTVDDILPLD
ncbi:helix-turn-helix transcriptional regulator [Porphyrobacter sp. AAP82]|uniref:helix-turn-helix transcriptional regulator n=1 Tax=Porphyrobacter sp. AAP82 TaxID=1248917 RepID=UPI0003756235|nr:helix-turn-helix transcriptional regulator [Porphyrobacter sp. AAP82]